MWTITTRRCTLQLFVRLPTQPVVCCSILCFCCYHYLVVLRLLLSSSLLLYFRTIIIGQKWTRIHPEITAKSNRCTQSSLFFPLWRRHLFASPLISLFLLVLSTPRASSKATNYTMSCPLHLFVSKATFSFSALPTQTSRTLSLFSSLPSPFLKFCSSYQNPRRRSRCAARRVEVVPLNSMLAFSAFRHFSSLSVLSTCSRLTWSRISISVLRIQTSSPPRLPSNRPFVRVLLHFPCVRNLTVSQSLVSVPFVWNQTATRFYSMRRR
mmetsp:Transcript_7961/g.23535  ORF Transcript_7961/g.23535 Transcript_7961/m.23535 type:complete len:267 (+) Transcript_7961:228-1028(+)